MSEGESGFVHAVRILPDGKQEIDPFNNVRFAGQQRVDFAYKDLPVTHYFFNNEAGSTKIVPEWPAKHDQVARDRLFQLSKSKWKFIESERPLIEEIFTPTETAASDHTEARPADCLARD